MSGPAALRPVCARTHPGARLKSGTGLRQNGLVAGRASISADILARYAADAACAVPGVRGLVESHLPRHHGVRIVEDEGRVRVELHVEVEWAVSIPDVGRAVQQHVRDYLGRMADVEPESVDVVVDDVAAPVG